MSGVNVQMLILSLGGEFISILRLICPGHVQVCFCFSQVGVISCVRSFLKTLDTSNIDEDAVIQFFSVLEDSELPDFSDKYDIAFSLFNSLFLSSPFDIIVAQLNYGVDVNSHYESFTQQDLSSFAFPSKQMKDLTKKFSRPVELSAHIYYAKTKQLEIAR